MNEWHKLPPKRADLMEMVKKAQAAYEKMSKEQQDEMWRQQRESFARGMMPTGDPRFD